MLFIHINKNDKSNHQEYLLSTKQCIMALFYVSAWLGTQVLG